MTQINWTRLADELPSEGGRYLVWREGREFWTWREALFYPRKEDSGPFWMAVSGYRVDNVTHWARVQGPEESEP